VNFFPKKEKRKKKGEYSEEYSQIFLENSPNLEREKGYFLELLFLVTFGL
jgi:hypothetical protein